MSAIQEAKAALDRIKVKTEKGRDKDSPDVTKLENPEEFQAALDEAKGHLNSVLELEAARPRLPSPQPALYAIDKIALIRNEPEYIQAAIDEAKAKLDELVKQESQQHQNGDRKVKQAAK